MWWRKQLITTFYYVRISHMMNAELNENKKQNLHLYQFPQQLCRQTNMYKLYGCKKEDNLSDYNRDGEEALSWKWWNNWIGFVVCWWFFFFFFSRFHLSTEVNYTYGVWNTYRGGSFWCAWIDRVFIQWLFDVMVWQTEPEF